MEIRRDVEAPGAGDSREPLLTLGLKSKGKEGDCYNPESHGGHRGGGAACI